MLKVVLISLLCSGSALRVQREEKNQAKNGGALLESTANATRQGKSFLEKSELGRGCGSMTDETGTGTTTRLRTRCECWMQGAGSPYSVLDCLDSQTGMYGFANAIYESGVDIYDCLYSQPLKANWAMSCFKRAAYHGGIHPEAWANMWGLSDDYNPWSSWVSIMHALRSRAEPPSGDPTVQTNTIIYTNPNGWAYAVNNHLHETLECTELMNRKVFSVHGGSWTTTGLIPKKNFI